MDQAAKLAALRDVVKKRLEIASSEPIRSASNTTDEVKDSQKNIIELRGD